MKIKINSQWGKIDAYTSGGVANLSVSAVVVLVVGGVYNGSSYNSTYSIGNNTNQIRGWASQGTTLSWLAITK